MRFTSSRDSPASAAAAAGAAVGATGAEAGAAFGAPSCALVTAAANSRRTNSLVAAAAIARLLVFVIDFSSRPRFQARKRHAYRALTELEHCGLLLIVVVF